MPNLNVGFLFAGALALGAPMAHAGDFDDYPNAESCAFMQDVLEVYYQGVVLGTISNFPSQKYAYNFFEDVCNGGKYHFDVRAQTQQYFCLKLTSGWVSGPMSAQQYFYEIDNKYANAAYESARNNVTKGARYLLQEIPGLGISFCGNYIAQCGSGEELAGANERGPFAMRCESCGAGTYSPDGECLSCPGGGTSDAGATDITKCYITSGGTDETGTYTFTDKCYYTK